MSIDKVILKRRVVYRARVLIPNGKRLSKCFDRKVDAARWEASVRLDGSQTPELLRKKYKFEDLCARFLMVSKAESAFSSYQKFEGYIRLYFLPYFGNCWLEDINRKMIEDFKLRIAQCELAPSTKRALLFSLNGLFKRALEWEMLAKDPTTGVRNLRKGIRKINYWTESEAKTFLSANQDNTRLPLYLIALNTGMRLGEIFGLKWDVIDLENKLITIRRTYDQKMGQTKETTKSNRMRVIGINESLLALFRMLRNQSESEYVLDRMQMGLQDPSHAAREFAADCERSGVKKIRFHDLRHTYATLYVGKGGNQHHLAGALGHSSLTITSLYAHYDKDHAQTAAQVVSLGVEADCEVVSLVSARASREKSGHKLVMNS